MKKTLAFIVLVALLINCTHTIPHYFDYERKRPIVISKRVGETIEPEEREKFDLFHGIDEFKAAVFYSISGGGYEVEIITEDLEFVAINRDFQAVVIVRDYINGHDEILKSRRAFEKKWKIAAYDDLGFPITHDEVNRIRRRETPYVVSAGCGLLGCAGGYGLSLILALVITGMDESEIGTAAAILYGGAALSSVVGVITGIFMGNRISKSNAINAIKDARKTRVVE
jgi:hypothetical protein